MEILLLGIYLGCTDRFYDTCMGVKFRKMVISIYLGLFVGVCRGSFVSQPVSQSHERTNQGYELMLACFLGVKIHEI